MAFAYVSWRDDDLEACAPCAKSIIKITELMAISYLEITNNLGDLFGDESEVAIHGIALFR